MFPSTQNLELTFEKHRAQKMNKLLLYYIYVGYWTNDKTISAKLGKITGNYSDSH